MQITVTTTGGFTGRGLGGASVDSEDPRVAAAWKKARPESWKPEYPARGGDLVGYTLTAGDRSVSWMTGAAIPPDLEELFEAVWNCRDTA